jgi:hypothetical protein
LYKEGVNKSNPKPDIISHGAIFLIAKETNKIIKKNGDILFFLNYRSGTLGTAATYWPIVPAPDDR